MPTLHPQAYTEGDPDKGRPAKGDGEQREGDPEKGRLGKGTRSREDDPDKGRPVNDTTGLCREFHSMWVAKGDPDKGRRRL